LIEDHRDIWPVRVMCEALSVSPSGYYAWRPRPDSPRKIANRALLVDIRRVHAQHREQYGAPRIHAELRAAGQTVRRKRVERVYAPAWYPGKGRAAIACAQPTASIACQWPLQSKIQVLGLPPYHRYKFWRFGEASPSSHARRNAQPVKRLRM